MNNKEDILRKFLDGELTEEEESLALHQIADDRQMREMLRFERFLFHTMRQSEPDILEIPSDFTDSVMQKIEASKNFETEKEQVAAGETPFFERLKNILENAFAPRQFSLRPVWVLAVLLIAYMAITFPNAQKIDSSMISQGGEGESFQMASDLEEKVWVRFVYFDDEAENVSVAGDFSNWEPVELNREFSGDRQVWTGMVQLERGEQRYMFIKNDEQWVTDPFAEIQRDDGFGNKNAVIYL